MAGDEVTSIPVSLTPFFQEYEFTRLEVRRSASTIIERVLQFGNREEIRWLFTVYPRQQIADWIGQWGSFALPEPHLTFWKLILGNTGVQIGFYGYGYRMVAPFVEADGVRLASVADIGLMKLDALMARASRKDFYDLYAICQNLALRELFDFAPQKYPHTRDFEAQAVKRLVYFERAEQEEPPFLIQEIAWETVKEYFRQQAGELGNSWLQR